MSVHSAAAGSMVVTMQSGTREAGVDDAARRGLARQLADVIAWEMQAQARVERALDQMPPLIADTVLAFFEVRLRPGAVIPTSDVGSSHQAVPSVNMGSPLSSAALTAPARPGLPSDTDTTIPVSQYQIAITHTGAYDYVSPPLPITHAPNAMGVGYKIINGQATIRPGRVGITLTADGKWVIEARFTVTSLTGHPVLQFDNAFVEGTAGR